MDEKWSRCVTSRVGQIAIVSVYTLMIIGSAIAVSNLKVDFKITYFINEDAYIRNYLDISDKYFQAGEQISFYVDNDGLDYTSVENQLQLALFSEKIQACETCNQVWLSEKSFDSWYDAFKAFSQANQKTKNSACKGSWDDAQQVVVPGQYMSCLKEYLSGQGSAYAANVLYNADETNLKGFKIGAQAVTVDSAAVEGVQLLEDLRAIQNEFGIDRTFSFSQRYYDYESYVVFAHEATLNVILALLAVFCVLIFVTANLVVTFFVLFCVILVDLFLFAFLSLLGVALNSVTVVNITIAIGLAVDYSAHIAHAYLTVDPPETSENGEPMTNADKRRFKARGALSTMGSSVFHGAFSTFLAIVVLAPSASYVFETFFRMWFGIIVFGVSNGFILLPVMLSLCGPLNKVHHAHNQVSDDETETAKKAPVDVELASKENAIN